MKVSTKAARLYKDLALYKERMKLTQKTLDRVRLYVAYNKKVLRLYQDDVISLELCNYLYNKSALLFTTKEETKCIRL